MESLKDTILFKFEPGTLEGVRKVFNLDQPGRMEEAVNIIEEWIQKQNHFVNKNFDRAYLERIIIRYKGSLERVKAALDKKCTILNHVKLFGPHNLQDFFYCPATTHGLMSRLTKDYKRIYLFRINPGVTFTREMWLRFYKGQGCALEYNLKYDYMCSYHIVFDLRYLNVIELSTSLNISDARESILVLDTYGVRVHSLHILSTSKLVDIISATIKQLIPSFKYDIQIHADLESLYKYLPKDLLAADYGGLDDTLDDIMKKHQKAYLSQEFRDHMEWVYTTKTDESRRLGQKCNDELYQGTVGTFRTLTID